MYTHTCVHTLHATLHTIGKSPQKMCHTTQYHSTHNQLPQGNETASRTHTAWIHLIQEAVSSKPHTRDADTGGQGNSLGVVFLTVVGRLAGEWKNSLFTLANFSWGGSHNNGPCIVCYSCGPTVVKMTPKHTHSNDQLSKLSVNSLLQALQPQTTCMLKKFVEV